MANLLDFESIKTRIEACLVYEATVPKQGVRQEALRGLHYLFLSGEEMPRGDFKAMLAPSELMQPSTQNDIHLSDYLIVNSQKKAPTPANPLTKKTVPKHFEYERRPGIKGKAFMPPLT
jgi:hypothetical protein